MSREQVLLFYLISFMNINLQCMIQFEFFRIDLYDILYEKSNFIYSFNSCNTLALIATATEILAT